MNMSKKSVKKQSSEDFMSFEDEYSEAIRSSVLKLKGHRKKRSTKKKFFAIVTIAKHDRFGGTRTVAIFDSFQKAKNIIENYGYYIWENSYNLCLIEAVEMNRIYGACSGEQYWYKWYTDKESYSPIEIPEVYKCTVGWSMS